MKQQRGAASSLDQFEMGAAFPGLHSLSPRVSQLVQQAQATSCCLPGRLIRQACITQQAFALSPVLSLSLSSFRSRSILDLPFRDESQINSSPLFRVTNACW